MKNILIVLGLIFCLSSYGQVYDGITQGTTYRFLLPVSVDTHTHDVSSAASFSYMRQVKQWFSVTGVGRYNFSEEGFSPQLWLNFSLRDRFYFLMRNCYDTKTEKFSETLSATYKAYKGLHFDWTWENVCRDIDRMQLVAGYDIKRVIVNGGYSFREQKGVVANLRFRVDKLNWVQLKYDSGAECVTLTAAYNFNSL